MEKKALKIAGIIVLVATTIAGYFVNFSFMLAQVSPSGAISLLSFMIFYALLYLSCWLLVLYTGLKRNSKRLLRLYQIFWFIATAFLLLTELEPQIIPQWLGFFGFFVFVVPLVGFDGLVFYINSGYFYASNLYLALTASLIMFLLGFFARRKFIV